LGIGQLGMAFQQKRNRIRLVLALGYWRVARALVLEDLGRKGLRGKLEPRLRVRLTALDLLRGGLAVRNRVEPLHLVRHFAIGDGLDLERVQLAEIRYLVKSERRVFDQPYGGRLGHQRSGHDEIRLQPRADRPKRHPDTLEKVKHLYNRVVRPVEDEGRGKIQGERKGMDESDLEPRRKPAQ